MALPRMYGAKIAVSEQTHEKLQRTAFFHLRISADVRLVLFYHHFLTFLDIESFVGIAHSTATEVVGLIRCRFSRLDGVDIGILFHTILHPLDEVVVCVAAVLGFSR